MSKILVISGARYYDAVKKLGDFSDDVRDFMDHPEEYCLVMFTGGEDVSPEFYGETSPHKMCYHNIRRDVYERRIFEHALHHNIKMTGICRGLQFLNVMAGGKMVHHLNGHTGCSHHMSTSCNEELKVNSLHHQMVLPREDAVVIGWSTERRSDVYYGDRDLQIAGPVKEIEAVIFPEHNAVAVQYHPEMMRESSDGYKWYEQLVSDLLASKSMDDLVKQYTSGDQSCIEITQAG